MEDVGRVRFHHCAVPPRRLVVRSHVPPLVTFLPLGKTSLNVSSFFFRRRRALYLLSILVEHDTARSPFACVSGPSWIFRSFEYSV